MTLSASVIDDAPQSGGRRYVRYRYEDADRGVLIETAPRLVPADFDAPADATGAIPKIESGLRRSELLSTVDAVLDGENLADLALRFNTQGEVLTFLAQRLFNLMREGKVAPDALYRIVKALPQIGKYTDAQIAGAVGWTEAQVSAARAKLLAYKQATDDLDHGRGKFEGVD